MIGLIYAGTERCWTILKSVIYKSLQVKQKPSCYIASLCTPKKNYVSSLYLYKLLECFKDRMGTQDLKLNIYVK